MKGNTCYCWTDRRQASPYLLKFPGRTFMVILLMTSFALTAQAKSPKSLQDQSALSAQQTAIFGNVSDTAGQPISGASITVSGNKQGTFTDNKGFFSINASLNDTLVISFVGYQSLTLPIDGKKELRITLLPIPGQLSDIVVVGYGTQKKADLTGSVASISSKNLENRPVTNVSTALAGLAPGLSVIQGSGDPRSDGASLKIRGVGTLNNSAPLVIIDGIQGSMDAVNPNDVESVSILKDAASAAIYGAQAANGVILITTKKGTNGPPSVTYTGLLSQSSPINLPKFVTNYAQHMELINEGLTNLNQQPIFSQETIDTWREKQKDPNGLTPEGIPNYIAYPNTNWSDALFEKNIVQNHNLSVIGGGENVRYLLSAGYLNNPGTIQYTGSERYQIRANVEAKIGKHIKLGTQTFASFRRNDLGNATNAFTYLRATTPGIVPEYDGKYGGAQAPGESATANAIYAFLNNQIGKDHVSQVNTTLYSSISIIKGLTLDSKFNYQTWFQERNYHGDPLSGQRWDFLKNQEITPITTPDQLSTTYSFEKNYEITFNHVLHYNTLIAGIHNIGAMAGYEQYYYDRYYFNATMKGLIDPSVTTLSSATQMTGINGDESDHARRSVFGRINYSYKDKYLFEANLRYDGSSRFSSESRWGVFPSISAGWRISQEGFFKNWNVNIQDLKLRASWGKLGNNRINVYEYNNNYDYQANYGTVNYSFNNVAGTGLRQSKLANPDLRWESTTVTDIGIDATLLNGHMNLTLDYYNKQTDGILTSPPIHLTMGTVGAPTLNTAGVLNRGVEISLGWQDYINDFHYSVNGQFAYNFNKVTKYKGLLKEGWVTDDQGNRVYQTNLGDVSSGGTNRILEGHIINEYYMQQLYSGSGSYNNADGTVNPNGGPKDGMIRTQADMQWLQAMVDAGYTFLPIGAIGQTKIYYGDFIYADNNGDGIYGNSFDQQFTDKSSTPKYNFGLNATASWKGFDFSMLWSGSAGMSYYWFTGQGFHSNITRNGLTQDAVIAKNHYYYNENDPNDPKNNIQAKYPRLKDITDNQNGIASNFWLYDASYIKLKNIQIGYTLPTNWVQAAWMTSARIFLSGENLLMITDYPGLDPEIGASEGYPTMKQYSFGVSIKF